jgi:hypothetical protein
MLISVCFSASLNASDYDTAGGLSKSRRISGVRGAT